MIQTDHWICVLEIQDKLRFGQNLNGSINYEFNYKTEILASPTMFKNVFVKKVFTENIKGMRGELPPSQHKKGECVMASLDTEYGLLKPRSY